MSIDPSPSASPRPRVLVLMASYNGSAWIEPQVASILDQTGVAIELVIRDDCSTDSSVDVVTQAFPEDARIRIVRACEPSGSAGANFRELIRTVTMDDHDYIAFADQDDIWLPTKMRAGIDALRRSGAGGYSAAVEAFWPSGRRQLLSQNAHIRNADFLFEGAGQGCTFVMSAELFKTVQNFINSNLAACNAFHYHDWLVYLIARSYGYEWYFDGEVVMRYRQHGGNEIGARGGLVAVSKRIKMIKSGWYRRQLTMASNLYLASKQGLPEPMKVAKCFNVASPNRGVQARLTLAWLSLTSGRRRFSDRLVVAVTALVGWI